VVALADAAGLPLETPGVQPADIRLHMAQVMKIFLKWIVIINGFSGSDDLDGGKVVNVSTCGTRHLGVASHNCGSGAGACVHRNAFSANCSTKNAGSRFHNGRGGQMTAWLFSS